MSEDLEEAYVLGEEKDGIISVCKSERVDFPIFELGSVYEMGVPDLKENGLDAHVYSTHTRETLDEIAKGKSLKELFDTWHRKNIKVDTPNSVLGRLASILKRIDP